MWSLDYIISIITYYSLILLLFKWTFALFRHYLFISFYYVLIIVSKSCLERAFVTLKRIIVLRTLRACALIWCVCGARGDKILRTNGGEEFVVFQRERDRVCYAPDPTSCQLLLLVV